MSRTVQYFRFIESNTKIDPRNSNVGQTSEMFAVHMKKIPYLF